MFVESYENLEFESVVGVVYAVNNRINDTILLYSIKKKILTKV